MDIGYELYQIKTIQNRMLELPITDFNLHKMLVLIVKFLGLVKANMTGNGYEDTIFIFLLCDEKGSCSTPVY